MLKPGRSKEQILPGDSRRTWPCWQVPLRLILDPELPKQYKRNCVVWGAEWVLTCYSSNRELIKFYSFSTHLETLFLGTLTYYLHARAILKCHGHITEEICICLSQQPTVSKTWADFWWTRGVSCPLAKASLWLHIPYSSFIISTKTLKYLYSCPNWHRKCFSLWAKAEIIAILPRG